MNHKAYAQQIRKYITEQYPEEVSLAYIQERAGSKGHSFKDIMSAMHVLHGYVDIKKTVRDGQVYYKKYVKQVRALPAVNHELIEYKKKIRKEFYATPYVDPWPEACKLVWLDDWLVPEVNLEHYQKLKYGNTRGKSNARRNKMARQKRTLLDQYKDNRNVGQQTGHIPNFSVYKKGSV